MIDTVYPYVVGTKKGMSGFKEVDLQKTVKVTLIDTANDVQVSDIVKEIPS